MDATPHPDASARAQRRRRVLLWAALVVLLLVAQSLLVVLTIEHEASRRQDEADAAVAEAAADVRQQMQHALRVLQSLAWGGGSAPSWHDTAARALAEERSLLRIEQRNPSLGVTEAFDTPFDQQAFTQMPRNQLSAETEAACISALGHAAPAYSRTYFVPLPAGRGVEVIDLCLPVRHEGRHAGFVVGTLSLPRLLESAVARRQGGPYEFLFVEVDGTRLARAGGSRGAGVYVGQRAVDLPGVALQLRADSVSGRPSLIPNLTTALVLGLSLALLALVAALARDVRRRSLAEAALGEALALRKAMEDSLITGLRARDLEGRITYANPAFCSMVGFGLDELQRTPPPYWPAEHLAEYSARQAERLAGAGLSREGFETVFVRKSGERFPVMIYEAPLIDSRGQQRGWMSAVVDVSAQRRIEDLARAQQERLYATARLATVGEMASLLSHELNQPLAAIASYASGSLNLLDAPDAETAEMIGHALRRIGEQAERAGRVIKSVHDFVRRREQLRETVGADALIDAVLPLVRLRARKAGVRVELDLPPRVPRVVCDRTMIEQVLLNLTRNAIQAMEGFTPLERAVLTLRVRPGDAQRVAFEVLDRGAGITPEVAAKLFTPFFTTRAEGMGLGLSLCRTVVEQHGGALEHQPAAGGGTEFRFTLAAARAAEDFAAAAGATA
jgi:two-component system sensor histidine kinase DctS